MLVLLIFIHFFMIRANLFLLVNEVSLLPIVIGSGVLCRLSVLGQFGERNLEHINS